MKVLAVKIRKLGDTALWTSALSALKEMGAEIDLLYPEHFAALFQDDSRFNRHFHWNGSFGNQLSLWNELRKQQYDFTLNFHASSSSARLVNLTRSAQKFIHFHDRAPKANASTKGIPNSGIPMKATERDLNVVRALGWNGVSPPTKLHVSQAKLERGFEKFKKAGSPQVLFGISASRPSKEWPIEHYVALARELQDLGVGVVYQQEKDLRSFHFKSQLESVAHLIHTPTLSDLIGVLPHSKLYLGSDSGVKHVAAALGVKTCTLFGPESIGEWHCYTEPHIAIQIEVGCRFQDPSPREFSWCNEYRCPLASHACMRFITPAVVAEKIRRTF